MLYSPTLRERNEGETRIYVVLVSHLDTQWKWTLRDTIRVHLPKTLRENFEAFERFPRYLLNFDGAFRYALIREYDPAGFARVREAVRAGRWWPAGAFWEAADVNIPSPESLIRQALYGIRFFKEEFGVRPCDVFLPDCFGFGWALPSIAAHCGLVGFSTQKLRGGRIAGGIPFEIGVWEGPDGASLLAALRPGGYGDHLRSSVEDDPETALSLDNHERATGRRLALRYFGTGDTGGAVDPETLARVEQAVDRRPPNVIVVNSGQIFTDLAAVDAGSALPRHRGELLLSRHGTGCYTSQAGMKRFNRANEQLADAAERAACAAHWLGGRPYPGRLLRDAWQRFLAHQFHDDITGTSIPEAYEISWNDEATSINQFHEVLRTSVGAVSRALDTSARGAALVVFNALSRDREDVVDVRFDQAGWSAAWLRVLGPDGVEVPSQSRRTPDGKWELAFLARVPAVGFAVFDAIPSDFPCAVETGVHAAGGELENRRYRARLDGEGNLSSCFDRELGRELLAAPVILELLADRSTKFPAWEILYDDLRSAPRERVGGPAEVRVVESGPVRASLEVTRRVGRSLFRECLSLAAGGAGDRLEIASFVEWRARGRLLKARFTPDFDSPTATYDLGIGAITRGINSPDLYEVPAQQWADLSCADRGVAILNDCKYGWDRPDASTLRLTLLHTPAIGRRFRYQRGLDRGRHQFTYAIAGHAGDWRSGDVPFEAARLNQRLRAFRCAPHPGPLGRSWSFLRVEPDRIAASSLKLAESGEDFILRLQEQHGGEAGSARVSTAAPVESARFVNGVEEPRSGSIELDAAGFETPMTAFSPSAIAFRLPSPAVRLAPAAQRSVPLKFDRCVASFDSDRTAGDFDGRGRSLPGELLSAEIDAFGVRFHLGPLSPGTPNAVDCRGQSVPIDAEPGTHLHFLAASAGEDVLCEISLDGRPMSIRVPSWSAVLARADRRRFGRLRAGYFRAENVAWVGTHRHSPKGDEPYVFCYLYRVMLVLDKGAKSIELPQDPRVRLLAATVAENVFDEAETISPLM